MFWDRIASSYDFFEKVYNEKVYKELGKEVATYLRSSDVVLECACGTGAITVEIAAYCQQVVATDFSEGMLKQARKKCARLKNIEFRQTDIMHLEYEEYVFDKVVAGNVIHLLDEPQKAVEELMRVCRTSGKVILPCYVNIARNGKPSLAARFLTMLGLRFKLQFSYASYQEFIHDMGYSDVTFSLVEGRMPCAIAVILKQK